MQWKQSTSQEDQESSLRQVVLSMFDIQISAVIELSLKNMSTSAKNLLQCSYKIASCFKFSIPKFTVTVFCSVELMVVGSFYQIYYKRYCHSLNVRLNVLTLKQTQK